MPEVTRLTEPYLHHYDPKGKLIGILNIYESFDLLCQIIDEQVDGYKIHYRFEDFIIDKERGYLPYNPYKAILHRIEQKYT